MTKPKGADALVTTTDPAVLADEQAQELLLRACYGSLYRPGVTVSIPGVVGWDRAIAAVKAALRPSPATTGEDARLTSASPMQSGLVNNIGERGMALLWFMSDEQCLDAEDPALAPFCDDRGDETDTINLCFEAGLLEQTGGEDIFMVRITDAGRAALNQSASQSPPEQAAQSDAPVVYSESGSGDTQADLRSTGVTQAQNDAVREAAISLALAAGKLNVALDGQEKYRRHRQAVVEAMRSLTTVLSATPPAPVEGVGIPPQIAEQVLAMGRVQWGATAEQRAEKHLADFERTLRITREHFNYEDVPVALHGLYLEGTDTVLCHTGTSPNSGANAQALTGAWNWLHDQCSALRTASPAPEDNLLRGEGVS